MQKLILYLFNYNNTHFSIVDCSSDFASDLVFFFSVSIAFLAFSGSFHCGGLVPNASDSYRTELAGQVGIASFLESVIMDNINATPTVTVSCDGLSALNRTGLSLDTLRASDKHMDMVSILSSLWYKIPFAIAREHVYGHQDEQVDRELTILEELNCKMDEKAKAIAQLQIDSRRRYRVPPTHLGFGTVKCNGTLVTSHIQTSLYNRIVHQGFVERLEKN